MLRYVDATSAAVWVETRDAARVVVRAAGRSWEARTFAAHGHHYALVEVAGLQPGSIEAYSVEVDGTPVWPDAESDNPASVIAVGTTVTRALETVAPGIGANAVRWRKRHVANPTEALRPVLAGHEPHHIQVLHAARPEADQRKLFHDNAVRVYALA